MEPIFTKNACGTRLLHLNDFTFRRRRIVNSREYWGCEVNCGVTCITDNSIIITTPGDHSHDPDRQKVRRLIAIDQMKDHIANNYCSLREAYDVVLTELRQGTLEERTTAGL